MSASPRSYHHGHLREAAIEAAVAEVERVGAAGVSMREIARRAGVTHAALAYQFGDKSGLFTAVATEGFRLAAAAIGPAATGPEGFLNGGMAYVMFALTHPGHYEVMFRPDLYGDDDPNLIEGMPVRDALLVVSNGVASLQPDPPVSFPGADFSDLSRWTWKDSNVVADNGVARSRLRMPSSRRTTS